MGGGGGGSSGAQILGAVDGGVLGAGLGNGLGLGGALVGGAVGAKYGAEQGPSLLDPLTGQQATQDAIDAQTAAANNANATQLYMYNQSRADTEPWRQAGVSALGDLQNPDFQKSFSQTDFQADPGYQFRMSEGAKALQQSAAAKGGLLSGGTAKSLERYSQGVASDEYNQAYNRYNNDQTTRFNRLASVAGLGQTATGQQLGAGQNYSNNVSANQIGAGNAVAAANIAQANRTSNLIGQGVGAGAMVLASDRRLKMNIEPIPPEDLKELKSNLRAYRFNYKSKDYGVGDFIGVMAQDLAKSKLGRSLLMSDEKGMLVIDTKKLMSLFLATMAEA